MKCSNDGDGTRFDNFLKVVKSTADLVGFQNPRGLCRLGLDYLTIND